MDILEEELIPASHRLNRNIAWFHVSVQNGAHARRQGKRKVRHTLNKGLQNYHDKNGWQRRSLEAEVPLAIV